MFVHVPRLVQEATALTIVEKETGNGTFNHSFAVVGVALPPWVQVGNDADPDERSGSFTENRQNWKRCPDAG